MPLLDYGTVGYKGLSYSRRCTFNTCKRKFEIENGLGLANRRDNVTFSYGHAVAAGVQEYCKTGSEQLAILACTRDYTIGWDELGSGSDQRNKKSVWYAIDATLNYIRAIRSDLIGGLSTLRDYELAYVVVDGKEVPAIEIQFRVVLENGFVYEGHIDLILRHRVTGEFIIVEIKTTSLREPHDALYANSEQALSYSVVLDHMVAAHGSASYKVFYLVYSSSKQEWILKEFVKQVKHRIDWINNLVRDTELIQYYQSAADEGIPYPTDGASCFEFFSPCNYFGSCTMDNDNLITLYRQIGEDSFAVEDNTHFVFTLDEILNSQVELADERAGLTELTVLPGVDEI